ncbi:MAG TPA: FHA domain-containing protein [Roseiflexaceae bacterium]|nr:FHA domain-containing protein [Roseiflexaceae bacterium]
MTASYILITDPDGRRHAIPLRAGVLHIGSAPDNDVVLSGPGIAPRHATIRCDDEGDLLLTIGGCDARSGMAALEIELPRAFATAMLARIGGYALRYQPAARPSQYPAGANQWSHAYYDPPFDGQITLLRDLLDQRIVWVDEPNSHEAATIEMPALRGVTLESDAA